MASRTHFEIEWRYRPKEEAAHFNPAFCGELIARAIKDFQKQTSNALPLAFGFLILPLVLHPASRRALPGRSNTAFASWAGENADILSTLADRTLRLRPVTREAMLFLVQVRAVELRATGLVFGEHPLKLGAKPLDTTEEVDAIRRAASMLGRWFGNQADAAAVLQTMGVRV